VTASGKLQPCRKSNAQYTPVSENLQPHPGDFLSNDVTSGHFRSPEFTWRHLLSPDYLLLRAKALYKVKRSVRQFLSFNSHFQVTSAQMTSLPVTWGHVTSFPVTWLPPARYQIEGCQTHSMRQFSTSQPLPGDFWSNDATSKSLPLTWGHVTSFSVTWLPPPASNSHVGSQTHIVRQFSSFYSHFQVTFGEMSHFRSPEVMWRHFLSRDCLLLQATALKDVKRTVYASFRPFTATSRWLPVKWRHFRLLPPTWGHVTSFLVTWLPRPASNSLVGSQKHSICQFSAFYSHFQVTSD